MSSIPIDEGYHMVSSLQNNDSQTMKVADHDKAMQQFSYWVTQLEEANRKLEREAVQNVHTFEMLMDRLSAIERENALLKAQLESQKNKAHVQDSNTAMNVPASSPIVPAQLEGPNNLPVEDQHPAPIVLAQNMAGQLDLEGQNNHLLVEDQNPAPIVLAQNIAGQLEGQNNNLLIQDDHNIPAPNAPAPGTTSTPSIPHQIIALLDGLNIFVCVILGRLSELCPRDDAAPERNRVTQRSQT